MHSAVTLNLLTLFYKMAISAIASVYAQWTYCMSQEKDTGLYVHDKYSLCSSCCKQ